MNNQQQYLSYFNQSHSPHQTHHQRVLHRSKTSQYQLAQQQKLLPHIIEQYQFRITNELLDHKIKHPRRDKLIIQSMNSSQIKRESVFKKQKKAKIKEQTPQKENSKFVSFQHEQKRGEGEKRGSQKKSLWGKKKRKEIERTYKTFDEGNSPCHNYMNEYLIALENNRMGKRLINTRSMVQDILTKTYYTYQLYNGKLLNRDKFLRIKRDSVKFRSCNKNFGKINNGIKSFFQKIIDAPKKHNTQHLGTVTVNQSEDDINNTMILEDKTQLIDRKSKRPLTHHGYETNNPHILETYGEGNYNFALNRMVIQSNPPLKPETMLVVQLIEKYQQLTDILNKFYAEKNNFFKYHCRTESGNEKQTFTSASFPYQYISNEINKNFGIKFRLSKQNEFYLRLLRNEGINQIELGVVKINLEHFFSPVESQFPVKTMKQMRQIDGEMHERMIYQSVFDGNLLKLKKGLTSTEIHIEYSFYGRKFHKVEEDDEDNEEQFCQI